MAKGGFTGAVPPRETSPEDYSGVWDITEQYGEQKAGNWPFQADDCAPRSLRFGGDDAKLSRTPGVAGSASVFTLSCWVKRTLATSYDELLSIDTLFGIRFTNTDKLHLDLYSPDGSSWAVIADSQAVFRDPSAWYSIVLVLDSNAGTTNADRLKLWVNGEPSAFDFATYWGGLITGNIARLNTAVEHTIGMRGSSLSGDFLIADYYFIDGQALSPEEFGFFDGAGIWQPKRFTGDYSSGPVYTNDLDYTAAYSGYPLSNIFDGDPNSQWLTAAQAQLVTFTPSKPITFNDTLKIKFGGASHSVIYNGTTVTSNSGAGVYTVVSSGGGTLTSLAFQEINAGNLTAVYYIEVDGQILTDASVGRNSFHLDFSDNSSAAALGTDTSGAGNNWTVNNISVLQGTGNYVPAMSSSGALTFGTTFLDGFNGDITSGVFGPAGGTMTFSPSPGIAYTSSVEVITAGDAYSQASLNGATAVSTPNNTWTTLATGSGTISTIVFSDTNSSEPGFAAIRVDGVILTDYRAASANDSLVDSPVNGNEASTGAGGERRGNYATLNPLAIDPTYSLPSLSNGNLDALASSSGSFASATIGVSSGKYYWEVTAVSNASAGSTSRPASGFNTLRDVNSTAFAYRQNGATMGLTGSPTFATYQTGDVIGIALNVDSTEVSFYKNGALQGSGAYTYTNTANIVFPGLFSADNNGLYNFNFGQRPFAYTAPSGFSPLATSFMPEPTIKRGDEAMDVVLYEGNGTSQTIDNLRLSPDLVWIKNRDGGYNHVLFDIVRGTGGTKVLFSNRTTAEGGGTGEEGDTYGHVSSFNDDGFTVAKGTGNPLWVSNSGDSYVGWVWDAGTSTVTNNNGNIESTVRANPRTGVSIVTYPGNLSNTPNPAPTVGHGLNAKPALIISKSRNPNGDDSGAWFINHSYNYANWFRFSGLAGQSIASSGGGTIAEPTTSVFSTYFIVGSNCANNDYVAYCFAPVSGFSAFGSWVGSSSGSFNYTGFQPKLILFKEATNSGNWQILDAERNTYNARVDVLFPNLANQETDSPAGSRAIDFLSNGFMTRGTDSDINTPGETYVWAAFAESPFALNARAL